MSLHVHETFAHYCMYRVPNITSRLERQSLLNLNNSCIEIWTKIGGQTSNSWSVSDIVFQMSCSSSRTWFIFVMWHTDCSLNKTWRLFHIISNANVKLSPGLLSWTCTWSSGEERSTTSCTAVWSKIQAKGTNLVFHLKWTWCFISTLPKKILKYILMLLRKNRQVHQTSSSVFFFLSDAACLVKKKRT